MAPAMPAARSPRSNRTFASRVAKGVRYRASARCAFLDVGRSSAGTSLVAGTQRSGTTWFAELLNHDNRYRMITEPLHLWKSTVTPPGMVWGQYLAPDDEAVAFRPVLDALVTGRIRNARSDVHNRKRVARRRIIKCVTATNLLPWFWSNHPRMTTMHIVRHPFAVAHSLVQLGWHELARHSGAAHLRVDRLLVEAGLIDGPLRGERDRILSVRARCTNPFTLCVLRWCLENVVALRAGTDAPLHHVVHYERVVLDPTTELEPLLEVGIMRALAPDRFLRPSRTDYRHRVEAGRERGRDVLEFLAGWRDGVSRQDLRLGVEVIRTFGLDHLYDLDPLPHVTVQTS